MNYESTYELVARKAGNIAYRAAVGVAVAAALILVWVNGAVGIIGNEGSQRLNESIRLEGHEPGAVD